MEHVPDAVASPVSTAGLTLSNMSRSRPAETPQIFGYQFEDRLQQGDLHKLDFGEFGFRGPHETKCRISSPGVHLLGIGFFLSL